MYPTVPTHVNQNSIFFRLDQTDKRKIESYCNQVAKSIPGEYQSGSYSSSQNSVPSPVQPVTIIDRSTHVDNSTNIAIGNRVDNSTYVTVTPGRALTKEEEEEKRKKEAEKTATLIGAILIPAASALFAYFGRRYLDTKKNNEVTQKIIASVGLDPYTDSVSSLTCYENIYGSLKKLATIQQIYDKQQLKKEFCNLSALGFGLISAVSLFLGGIYKQQWMRTTAVVGLVAGLSLFVANQVWHWTDAREEETEDQKKLIALVRRTIEENPVWNFNPPRSSYTAPQPPFSTAYPQMYPPTAPGYAPGPVQDN